MKPENLNTGNGNLGLYAYPIRAELVEDTTPEIPFPVEVIGHGLRHGRKTRCLFFRISGGRPGEIRSAIWWRGAWRGGVESSWVLEGFRVEVCGRCGK